jgi:hypothetical protein
MKCDPGAAAAPERLEISGERHEIGGQQLASGDHDGIHRAPRVILDMTPEHLSNQPFRPVPFDGPAELLRRHDPKAMGGTTVGKRQEREIAAV